MNARIVIESQMPPALDAAIRRGLCLSFPEQREHFGRRRDWHGSFPAWSAIVESGDEVLAHVGVTERTIDAGGRTLRVAGVLNVFVSPAWRGKGLADRVMSAAMDEARRRGFDAGLLFCVPALGPVYARGGWRELPGRAFTRVDETGRELPIPAGNIAMFLPLGCADFPPGDVHLQGNDW